MRNIFKSLFIALSCLMATSVWAETAIFEGDNLNVSEGAKTVNGITLSVPSSNGMTWSNSSLYASGSGKQFILTANSGAISQVLITMNGTSNRYQASNITGCTDCTKDGSVYTCTFSHPQSEITFKNNGGGVGITKLEVTYSGESGGGDDPTPGGGDDPTPGGGDDPTPGGGDDPVSDDVLIKGTAQQEVSGPAAGSVETNLKKKDAVKLDAEKYFGLKLDNGYTLQEGDIFVISTTTPADLGKCMIYADNEGNDLIYDEGVEYSSDNKSESGEKKIVLPAEANGKTAIYLWRGVKNEAPQWNVTFDFLAVEREGFVPPVEPEKSNDATLKSLEYYNDGSFVSVPGFAPDKFSYSIVLPAEYVGGAPSIQAEKNDEKANIDVSQASTLPGTAKVVVTAEDGTKKTYTVDFSKASDDPTPGGGDDPQPTGDVYAHWRFSGSEIPAIGSSESGTNIKVEFLTSDDTKSFSTESAVYNDAVPDDMKSQGAKGLKNGANKLYLKVTVTGGFKANDVVTICGYNPWKVSSSDAHEGDVAASVATGTSKTDYNIGSFTLAADAEALYMMRADGTSTCICAIKVNRGGGDTPVDLEKSHDASLKSLSLEYGGQSVPLPDFSPTKYSYEIPVSAEYAALGVVPTVLAEKNDENATVVITQASGIPGTATVEVTAEDGTTTLTYSIIFSVEATPGGGDDPQPIGDVYAHWRFSGSEIPAIGSSESGTNIKVEFLTSDDTKSFSTESAVYNDAVPDDMKSQGAKGLKNGANKLYLKVTVTGGFKANDVVTICGYNPWKVSSSDAHEGDVAASVATGTSKTDYNIGSFTLSADAEALYMMRADGTSTCICAIKVTRGDGDDPVDPEESSDNTLKSLTYDGTPVPGFSPSTLTYDIELPAETTEVPEVKAEANNENATVEVIPATALPGTTSIKVTAENGDVATYKIYFTVEGTEPPAPVAVTGVTLNHNTLTLKVGYSQKLIATVTPVDATNTNVTWSSDKTNIATVVDGIVTAKAAGTATIKVKTEEGGYEASCEVTVEEETPDVPVPPTDLALHEPGTYEELEANGGYDAPMSIFEKREYEVFYAGRFEEKVDGSTVKGITIHVNPPMDKMRGITKNESESAYEAVDGWFKGSGKDKGTGFAKKEEFEATERCHTLKSNSIELHIKGYDQFSLYGADKKVDTSKPQNNKVFKVTINGVEQEMPISTDQTIRRFDISIGEQVILIESGDDCLFGGFSLRVAQVPMVKRIKGNDSTQVVLQTEKLPRAITYFTKYNAFGRTEVVWENGKEAKDIDLVVKGSNDIGDTLLLTGIANCEVGEYHFNVSSFDNRGKVTNSIPGKITVKSDIKAVGESKAEVYQGETMETLEFTYHALRVEDVHLDWTDSIPAGIEDYGENGKYYISGTPTQEGKYPFTISVKDCPDSIEGLVMVYGPVSGEKLVLYLYTNGDKNAILEQDGVATLLNKKRDFQFIARKALSSGLRKPEEYQKYKWVLISEDANANNEEVLALTQQSAILPVLNMKAFTYAEDRLSWGDPDNGSLSSNGKFITIQREDHPIFQGKKHGDMIQVLDTIDKDSRKGLMPIDIHLPGTHCLATALTRSKEDYYEDGEPQTFLHEVPANMRGGKKYLCLPISMNSSKHLTPAGEQLVLDVVDYLLSEESSDIRIEPLQITRFTVDSVDGWIDQSKDSIFLEIDLTEHFDVVKSAITPEIALASDYTHVTPALGEKIDFSTSLTFPVLYEVSDFINRRVYKVAIRFYSSEGIEEVYAVGDWVNIYDIFGRKVSATNEDIYHMVLPQGVYIIVTENGQTFKIMR